MKQITALLLFGLMVYVGLVCLLPAVFGPAGINAVLNSVIR